MNFELFVNIVVKFFKYSSSLFPVFIYLHLLFKSPLQSTQNHSDQSLLKQLPCLKQLQTIHQGQFCPQPNCPNGYVCFFKFKLDSEKLSKLISLTSNRCAVLRLQSTSNKISDNVTNCLTKLYLTASWLEISLWSIQILQNCKITKKAF